MAKGSLAIDPKFYKVLTDNLYDGVFQVDDQGRIVLWNQGAERITGIAGKKAVGKSCQDELFKHYAESGDTLAAANLPLLLTLKDGKPREVRAYLRHVEGFRVSVLIRTLPVMDANQHIFGGMEIFTDNKAIIAAHLRNQRVEQTVLFDPLTGIGNRAHIETKLKYALMDYEASRVPFGVLFMDIDHFKEFNDLHGHLAGDKILRFVANTIKSHLRVTDSCGRWGGEEFLALVMDGNAEGLQMVAEKLRMLVSRAQIEESGERLSVTISTGATMVHTEDSFETLMKRADELLYKSKQNGRNRVSLG